jgi:hypothetical protein
MITNNIYKTTQLTEYWVTTPNLFDDKEIDEICKFCEMHDQKEAEIIYGKDTPLLTIV